jgi:glycerol transport system ATP-binding protein
LCNPSEGKLLFDGVDVTTLSTSERNIAQVFQFPVIYGTMSVEQNLAFPLVCRNYEKSVIDAKVQEVAEALSLQGFAEKIGEPADCGSKTADLTGAWTGAR